MLSMLAVPGLLSATSTINAQALAQQWAGIYYRGKALGPQTALLSLLGYGYLTYKSTSDGLSWHKFVAAALLTIGIVPFTVMIMDPTNQALLQITSGASSLGMEATKDLLVQWKNLNLVRSFFPLAGAVLGLWELVV